MDEEGVHSEPKNAGKTWTRAEHEKIIDLLKEGKELKEIALVMGRTPGAVLVQMEYIAAYALKFDSLRKKILDNI